MESNLELLAKYRKHGEHMYLYLKRHTEALDIYYPTVTNQEIKLLFETRRLDIEKFSINFNRAMFLLEKLEARFNQKLEKLRNKEDLEDNYELTIELNAEYDLFFVMYRAMNPQHMRDAMKDTFKILNLNKEKVKIIKEKSDKNIKK